MKKVIVKNIKIEKIDNQGRGIAFINDKIAFVKNSLPGDIVDVLILTEKKKYILASVEKIINQSDLREETKCPYASKCGGCQFMEVSYDNSFKLKTESFSNYLKKNGILNELKLIKNDNPLNYRNKISLKIAGGKIGFYEESSKKIVEITKCMITNNYINEFLIDLKKLNIQNGFVTIKTNYLGELLVNINTKEELVYSDINVAGLVVNNNLIKGEKFFVDKINDLLFEVSYDSFFQVNPFVTSKLFNIINEYITKDDIVLDLYCGVGSLGLNASKKALKVYGIEVVKSAVINANNNALINHIDNAKFKVGDLSKNLKIKEAFNTIIIDPPRSGIDSVVMNFIKEKLPKKIIYVSCDYQTLVRDLKLLSDEYEIKEIYSLDMFSFSYHLESLCILERR